MRDPSKNADANPDGDRPERRTGEPKMKMTALVRSADCHVGGDDLTSWMACCKRPESKSPVDA